MALCPSLLLRMKPLGEEKNKKLNQSEINFKEEAHLLSQSYYVLFGSPLKRGY